MNAEDSEMAKALLSASGRLGVAKDDRQETLKNSATETLFNMQSLVGKVARLAP